MIFLLVLIVNLSFWHISATSPEKNYLMENARLTYRSDIVKLTRALPSEMHSVIFGVKQRNMDALLDILYDVSDPRSSNYGKHWTKKDVVEFTANPSGHENIMAFLRKDESIRIDGQTLNGEYIFATAPLKTWETLFDTQFFVYSMESTNGGEVSEIVRTEQYSLPYELADSVSAVFNTVQFPYTSPPRSHPFSKKVAEMPENINKYQLRRGSVSYNDIDWSQPGLFEGYVTPAFINLWYNVLNNTGSSLVSQCLLEGISDALNPEDLTLFQEYFNLTVMPIAKDFNGHISTNACNTSIYADCYESNLDVQYIMAIAENVPTSYYYDNSSGTLDWISWVTYAANSADPDDVYSMSYVTYELYISPSTAQAFDVEAIKLGVMGSTILAAAGDDGVVGFGARNNPEFCGYYAMYPASSPYVTAVGGTTGPQANLPEIACTATAIQALDSPKTVFITSGGGFSTLYAQPSFQTDVVNEYFAGVTGKPQQPYQGEYPYDDFYGFADFNPWSFNKSARAYPDVSLLAHNYVIMVEGTLTPVDGTSASTPTFGAFITLVNQARKEAGQSTMGWVNPFLYQNYASFVNDITTGFNNCSAPYGANEAFTEVYATCCAEGFYATPGWDPVTGLGVVDFAKFYSVAMTTSSGSSSSTFTSGEAFIVSGIVVLIAFFSISLLHRFYCQKKQ